MTLVLVLLICATPPTSGYEGCHRQAHEMPTERDCHHAGRRWVRTGQAENYACMWHEREVAA